MKRMLKTVVLLCLCAVLIAVPFTASAASEADITVNVRIEGMDGNVFYGDVTVSGDELTVAAAVKAVADEKEDIVITGLEDSYITDINGDAAGAFGGWEGWLFTVNGESPVVGIGECAVAEGDKIVLYYGDPFGVGMQYPVADTSEIAQGTITFTSTDTTYDENFNPVETVNPVVGATVTFDGKEYVTDDNGAVAIDTATLKNGEYALAIEKKDENGLPLVLRFAPDYTVTVSGIEEVSSAPVVESSDAVDTAVSDTDDKKTDVPKTADGFSLVAVLSVMLASAVLFAGFKVKNEK